jgi:hypothetical protein
MSADELEARLETLELQQSYQSNAIRAALEARWSGEADSVTGWLVALDPTLDGQLSPQTPLYPDT